MRLESYFRAVKWSLHNQGSQTFALADDAQDIYPLPPNPKIMNFNEQLYENYVASGQATNRLEGDASKQFEPNSTYIEKMIRLHFPNERSLRIIDLGCGHGGWLYFLKKHGYTNLAGVDISTAQVELAHSLGITEVQHGTLSPFLEKEQAIDVVLMMDILEHLRIEDSDAILRSIFEKLNSGGKLILHVPNAEGLFGQRIRYGDLTHETCFTPKSIHQLLKPIGFQNIRCYEDRPIIHGLRSGVRRILWDLGTIYPRLLLAAETGERGCVLSQNMTVVASAPMKGSK